MKTLVCMIFFFYIGLRIFVTLSKSKKERARAHAFVETLGCFTDSCLSPPRPNLDGCREKKKEKMFTGPS